jgi:sirohydrochlorin ferrochelatase
MKAYFFITHGSSDARHQRALQKLVEQVATITTEINGKNPTNLPVFIGSGCLESMSLPLHQQIIEFSRECLVRGYEKLVILPLFLLPGVHVMNDIPTEINLTGTEISQGITLELLPYIGSMPEIIDLINNQGNKLPKQCILLAHGSRRIGGNEIVENLGKKLGLVPAYWSTSPSLNDRVRELYQRGDRSVGIIPYFLFSGGITEAIAQQMEELKTELTGLQLHLSTTLGETPELVNLIASIIR